LKLTRIIILGFLIVGVGVVMLLPIETSAVPTWRIQVVDQDGNPLREIGLREYWGDYSVDYQVSTQDLTTDKNGFVTFGPRTTKATLLRRILYPLQNSLGGVHSSWGPHAGVIVLVNDASKEIGTAQWASGQPLAEKVAVKPMKTAAQSPQ